MIRNETEYKEAVARLKAEQERLKDHAERLKETGLSPEEIKRVIDPMESFHLQLKEEVESYERLQRGEFEDLDNFRGFGHLLIALRIAQGISQRDLAKRLAVHESQISRDERNEYFGITLERAMKILDALNVRLRTTVELEQRRQPVTA
ncbi:MAG: helix-turn-helix transcriptional regulator [Tepidisphaeraceae bacterium]